MQERIAAERKQHITDRLRAELSLKREQTEAVIRLIDEGNTIPFIARYRKEATGGMDDTVLRAFEERLFYLRRLWDRKETVLSAIEEQGKLTEQLFQEVTGADTLVSLEDIYRPYKQKKRTRAMIARERGLLPLAMAIQDGKEKLSLSRLAAPYVQAEKGVEDADAALKGASDILAEEISEDAAVRRFIREKTLKYGSLSVTAKDKDEKSVYELYYTFEEPVKKLLGHQILAINRGEGEKLLCVKLKAPEEEITAYLNRRFAGQREGEYKAFLEAAAADAYKRLIAPSVETEIRGMLKEKAEEGALKVFAENLRQLLMQPPMEGKTVLGWDPAFRTGCKLAVSDPTGKILDTKVIFPTAPQNKVEEALRVLSELVNKYDIDIISLGNGTASRESEEIIAKLLQEPTIKKRQKPLSYAIVSEAGASVYSASRLAAEEFPKFDVGQRSAASIARRLQDPLSELVKIDPRSVGVGQYQHDIDQKRLSEALFAVVEDCVNRVGVDLNTASAALLSYISGISKSLAENIVAYREEHGRFEERKTLLKVPKLGPKAYEQCAGFLRIRGGREALDMTGVHPESYAACKAFLKLYGHEAKELQNGGIKGLSEALQNPKIRRQQAEMLGIGEPTLLDMAKELEKPMRDPRSELPKPVLRSDILELSDLKPGMELRGTVRNVIDFGAFVDIGVHQDGLVHISELSEKFAKHPLDVVKIGDIVKVRVLSVDMEKKRIALSMKP